MCIHPKCFIKSRLGQVILWYNLCKINTHKNKTQQAILFICHHVIFILIHWSTTCRILSKQMIIQNILEPNTVDTKVKMCGKHTGWKQWLLSVKKIKNQYFAWQVDIVQKFKNAHLFIWFWKTLYIPSEQLKGCWPYFGPDIINYVFYSRWKGIIRAV